MRAVAVWRELDSGFEKVGAIDVFPNPLEPPLFRYDGRYLQSGDARAISVRVNCQGGKRTIEQKDICRYSSFCGFTV